MLRHCGQALWMAVLAAGVLGAAGQADGKAIETKGTIEAVTVYRGQALVTRVIALDAPAGGHELTVTDLPARIVTSSLYASGDGGVQIRAVRYRTRAVREEPREQLRQLAEKIRGVELELRKNLAEQKLLKRKDAYLGKLETSTTAKIADNDAKGTLKPETIEGVTMFLFKQREQLAKRAFELGESQRQIQEQLTLLLRQRGELASRSTRTAREAVVFLDKQRPGETTVRLTYLVDGASWSPMYNCRSNGPGEKVALEYNALVQQTSGEGWDGVRLTLSTASPTMVADAPILTPLWLTLASRPIRMAIGNVEMLLGGQTALGTSQQKALRARRGGLKSNWDQDWRANTIANRLQIMDLVARSDLLLAARKFASIGGVLSVSYTLDGRISLPSRTDRQMIQIASLKLDGNFYYLAAPVLTPYVYQQADVLNTSEIALLAGPVNTYLNGQFMGSGRMPMVAKGQRFSVGFGVDSQLRVRRELADKTDRTQGGNRVLSFTYRLLISNFKDRPVKVRLMDRLPDPKGADIQVSLLKTSAELSKDPVYLRTLRRSGILRWEIDVPAKSSGAKAKTVTYEFKMEFDRKMHLVEPKPAQIEKSKLEFREKLRMMQQAK